FFSVFVSRGIRKCTSTRRSPAAAVLAALTVSPMRRLVNSHVLRPQLQNLILRERISLKTLVLEMKSNDFPATKTGLRVHGRLKGTALQWAASQLPIS